MTSGNGVLDMLDRLPPISLPELQAEAEFLTRRDRKYLVPVDAAAALLAGIDPAVRVLEIDGRRDFGYLTPYFDDPDYSAYLRAAHRRPNRFKVRTRLYTESGLCWLEVKVRDARGRTVKHRTDHDAGALEWLADAEHNWLGAFPQVAPYADRLRHCLTTRYRRTTLVLPDGAGRVTIDRDLIFVLPSGESQSLPDYLVVETKGSGRPTPVDRLLWRHGYRPVSISKFACGLGLLVPALPANRWHRLRNRLAAASRPEHGGARVLPASRRVAAIGRGGLDGSGGSALVPAMGTPDVVSRPSAFGTTVETGSTVAAS
ncbi:MAG TPA: polyphosphate polymerase domain-containing protein [Acidimicrobiia bacterium]|nr:polyphosphate polymerase domain-containing protein [Acidimicrobiia bacterium]